MNPKDIRTNLKSGLQNTFDPADLELLVDFINLDYHRAKLDKKERDIDIIVDKIIELEIHEEKGIFWKSFTQVLCGIYEEKFRFDTELRTLADEKMPDRNERIIPY